ncbi:unnamed protein product [Sympodiomycopsis kandeliae]
MSDEQPPERPEHSAHKEVQEQSQESTQQNTEIDNPETTQASQTPTTASNSQSLEEKQSTAYLSYIKAVLADSDDEANSLEKIQDLADPTWFLRVLTEVDADHFRNPHSTAESGQDNFVIRLATLKRLSKLIAQYYQDPLQLSTSSLEQPDLDEIARSSSPVEIGKLCKLVLGITIQSERTKTDHITAIQSFSQDDQQSLMEAIAQVMSGLTKDVNGKDVNGSAQQQDDHLPDSSGKVSDEDHRQTLATLAKTSKEKDELQAIYLALVAEHQSLKASHEDSHTEKHELNKEIERLQEEAQRSKAHSGQAVLKAEVESIKGQLRKSEDNLAEAETEVERLSKIEADLSRKIADLQTQADEATKLKDQIDEYRHTADKAQRAENALEKYKKKLEESAGVRRQLKSLEDQNSELIDRNASLERDYAKLADFKPLMENYRGQIDDLNGKNNRLNEELTSARYNLEQSTLQVKALEEARNKDAEEMQLYQERVEELELGIGGSGGGRRRPKGRVSGVRPNEGAEGLAANDNRLSDGDDDDLDNGNDILVDDELENALQGTTMTDLKLRVHQLSRDLKAAKRNKADSSRILVLENLLEDSQRLKKKYEDDYWREYKSRLQLSGEMEKISNGTSSYGDGSEASHALRLRLNQLVKEHEETQKNLAELTVKYEESDKKLTIAESDLNLVNQDQVDILRSLRLSVNKEKSQLEEQVSNLRTEVKSSSEENTRLTSQIQTLLMDKIDLMEGGWSERESSLQREKELGELRTSLAGKKLPKDVEEMILKLTEENKKLVISSTDLNDRFSKAKSFIRQQDKLLKEAKLKSGTAATAGTGDEALVKKLKKEQEFMMSAWHHLAFSKGILVARPSKSDGDKSSQGMQRSWLGQEQGNKMAIRALLGRR